MKIVKNQKSQKVFYYISSGSWSTVTKASSKSEALEEVFRDILHRPRDYGAIGSVVVIMDIDEAMKDLTLESALKFISTEEALRLVGDPYLSENILGYGEDNEF